MGLTSGLFASVAGLNSSSTAIQVVGDNIANLSTPGFKERRAEFADVLGQNITTAGGFSQLGAGNKLSGISPIFSQGSFESTARSTDLAIEGRGFFILDGGQGRLYSRAGNFTFDANGLLVNPAGLRVQGFSVDPTTQQSTGQLGDIQLVDGLAPPQPTALVDVSVNLNANDPVTAPFDVNNPSTTSNHQLGVTVFDSLGNSHPMTLYFSKTGVNAWAWNATFPQSSVGGATPITSVGSGAITFDANGLMTAPATNPSFNATFLGGATPAQPIDLGFGPVAGGTQTVLTTQFGSPNATNAFSQDGFTAGTLQLLNIDEQGFLTGSFSNGTTRAIAQVGLADFPAVERLISVGDNNLLESRGSGQPLIAEPQTGSLGTIRSSSLEQSNVDLAAQFVRLIISQRAFQANTRTVSTTNELLANLVNLGQ